MSELTDFLTTLAGSPWAYVVMAAILVIDGFFPFVPGETGVVTLAALGASGHGPQVWLVLVIAVAATMVGDAIAFVVGRRIGIDRWSWMRRPRVSRAFAWAAEGLLRRPTVFLVIAKFVPFARVAVTMTAGAGGGCRCGATCRSPSRRPPSTRRTTSSSPWSPATSSRRCRF